MTNGPIPGQFYTDTNMLETLQTPIPSMLDMLNNLRTEQEDVILAVLAAGVPISCIAKEWPEVKTIEFNSPLLGLGFRFVGSV